MKVHERKNYIIFLICVKRNIKYGEKLNRLLSNPNAKIAHYKE